MYSDILLTVQDGVATITINRPQAKNAMTIDTFQEIKSAFTQCGENDEVRAVVVTGAGDAFSSGGDIEDFKSMLENRVTYEQGKENILLSGEMTYAGKSCFKPTIAMVNGACYGAGMSLALLCDFRVIDPGTTMCAAFINVGFTGDTGCIKFLYDMVGYAKMTEYMMLGRPIQADELMSTGLATTLAPEGKLEEETYKLARRLAKGPTASYARQKKLFWEYFYKDYDFFADREAHYMSECALTEDFTEAVTAFLEKRKPNYSGK